MRDAGVFLMAVLRHFAAWGTGGLLVLIFGALDYLGVFKLPKSWYAVFLAVGFVISCFQAWHDEYQENEASRTAGSLAMNALDASLLVDKPDGNKEGQIQIEIVFSNQLPKLLRYTVDKFMLRANDVDAPSTFANRGGYVYPSSTSTFRSARFTIPLRQPITGTLEYVVTYGLVGTRVMHHTSKLLSFECWISSDISRPLRIAFTTTKEYED